MVSGLLGLNDSKQLTEAQREKYYEVLTSHPEIRWAVARVEVEMIDRINIYQAAHRAMNLALDQLQPPPEHVLVDGRPVRSMRFPNTPLVKGDARSYSIAGASVLAKVTRDRLMREYDQLYPEYKCFWHYDCHLDVAGGNVHVYVKNTGGSAVTITDVTLVQCLRIDFTK